MIIMYFGNDTLEFAIILELNNTAWTVYSG